MFKIDSDPAEKFSIPIAHGIQPDIGAEQTKALCDQLAIAGVMCLKFERRLDKYEFERVAEIFGPIKNPVGKTKDGGSYQYSPKRQAIDAGYVLTDEDREKYGEMVFGGLDEQRPGLFETYHCDDTYTEDPAQLTILHARALPESGGGPTHFMDMRDAFNRLDNEMQRQLSPYHVLYAHNNENAFPPRRAATGEADRLIDVSHPLVRTHHIAGTKALFIDLDRAKQIIELAVTEGRGLLQHLQDQAELKAMKCQHHWENNDVLVWDNASVQHKAQGNFKLGEQRRFWRHMIAGPRPS